MTTKYREAKIARENLDRWLDEWGDTPVKLRRELRIAKLVASQVPCLSTVPGSAGARWTSHHRALANRRVRQIQKRMKALGIDPAPKFWKPLPATKADARIRRLYPSGGAVDFEWHRMQPDIWAMVVEFTGLR
jgi:hypothetical protein